MAESIGALNKAKRDGLTKHIGVCNYTVALLDEAWSVTKEPLVTNQIEVHPFLDQTKVIEATRRHGMSITAYCPIARGRVPGNPVLERIGAAHGKTASQVSLRWLTQQGIIVIPGSGKPERQKENLDVLDFSLSPAEMAEITALKRPERARRQSAAGAEVGRIEDAHANDRSKRRENSRARARHLAAQWQRRLAHHRAGAQARLPPSRLRADLWQREGSGRGAARLRRQARGCVHHHQGAAHRAGAARARTRREAEPARTCASPT